MSRELVMKLLRADSEGEVADIIRGDAGMNNPANWHPLDARETNHNVVRNQSSTGAKAATELITNMVDAVLMKQCLLAKRPVKGADAPQTMYDAVKELVSKSLENGKIINADDSWLRDYASDNLVIGVTGKRGKNTSPCFTFCDNGEGQNPEKFQSTFLSFSEGNKNPIPFVQGKYNMGSSGVLNFCGKDWHKLIVSRRYDGSGEWGWTLIRKNSPEEDKSPFAEYYAPSKRIPSAGKSPLTPFATSAGGAFEDFVLNTGTVVKLYDYYFGRSTNKFDDIREAFNENLVETILPFRIYDFRQTPSKGKGKLRELGIDPRTFHGMEFFLVRSHIDDEEAGDNETNKPLHVITHPDEELGTIVITAIPLKKSSNWATKDSKSRVRVFHHVNGQVQFKEMRGYLNRCKLHALKDRVVIFVDASNMKRTAHDAIWKGDRENITENRLGQHYKETVKRLLQESEMLKKLNHQISLEELNSVAKEGAKKVVEKLIAGDRNLRYLLEGKIPDIFEPGGGAKSDPEPRNDLKYHPSYLKAREKTEIRLPINKARRPIKFETDAVDDFFIRSKDRGELFLDDENADQIFSLGRSLSNGNLIVYLNPKKDALAVGKKYRFKIGLACLSMPKPLICDKEVSVTIVEAVKEKKPNPDPNPRPPMRPAGWLPEYTLLTKDGREIPKYGSTEKWADTELAGFNERDGGFVKQLKVDESIAYINYDNASFAGYLKSRNKTEASEKLITEKYILGMRILMLSAELAIKEWKQSQETDKNGDAEDDFRRLVGKAAAAVTLTLCDQLPKVFATTELDEDDDS